MEYTKLGKTGMSVSKICLGCFSFGSGQDWMLSREKSTEIIEKAIDYGINFFDTANIYSKGESERILGSVIDSYNRDEFVISTKVYHQMDEENPNSGGLSRKAIQQEMSKSLERLNIDTIDLYQIHRWDNDTPIEETLRTLDDAIRNQKVRNLGASAMWGYQLSKSLNVSKRLNLEQFVTMQNHYNLIYREEEREVIPLCKEEEIAVIPFSPLARGYLARPYDSIHNSDRGLDDNTIHDRGDLYARDSTREINSRVQELSEEKGVSMAQLSLAWLLHQDQVASPILGVTSLDQLNQVSTILDIDLSSSELSYLGEPYEPVQIIGHS